MADEQQESWWRRLPSTRTILAAVGVVLLLAGFVWLWWQGVPALYQEAGSGENAENTRLNAVVTTRAALLAGLVGLGALGTFWLNSRVYRITARTFELTEQGHITERYTKAIEQLGSDKLDVRLGGIYALERIAVDSKRDHPTIVEVLSAFVREHTAAAPRVRPLKRKTAHGLSLNIRAKKLGSDVQAVLTVLGRLPTRSGVSRGNLYGANIAGANLYGANLTDANMALANLAGARLVGADLTDAQLAWADLTEANLVLANLTGAGLIDTNLTGADLTLANLTGATIARTKLTGAIGANLTAAHHTPNAQFHPANPAD